MISIKSEANNKVRMTILITIFIITSFVYWNKRRDYLDNMEDYQIELKEKIEDQSESFSIKVKTPFSLFSQVDDHKVLLEDSIESVKESWRGTMHNVNLGDISIEAEYNSIGANVKHEIEYKNTKSEIEVIDKKIQEFIKDEINENMSDYEKIKEAYVYTVENLIYGSNNDVLGDRNVLLGLQGEPVVCEAYSFLFHRMAEMMGIESKIVWGVVENVNHTWNMVKIDGNWLHVDPTWGDNPDGSVNFEYFLIPERKMLEKGNRIMEDGYPSSIISLDR